MERSTKQREAIKSLFTHDGRPLSPAEVLDLAARAVPGISQATVYRTIRALVDAEFIVPVELPGEPARYERAGKDHHHHFRCDRCGRAYEIPDCPGDLSRMAPPGFRIERHEITLFGLCARCAGATKKKESH